MVIRKPCKEPGCGELTTETYCKTHKKEHRYIAKYNNLYGKKWRKESKDFLLKNIYCVECLQIGIETIATEVDHIKAHKGDLGVFWARSNWQALCKRCHSKKTAAENVWKVPHP